MNANAKNVSAPAVSSLRMILTLAVVATCSAVLIVLVVGVTEARITENRRSALERAVFTVIPGADTRKTFVLADDDGVEHTVYAGYKDGALVGVAIQAAQQGYQDVIRALYGYDPAEQRVIGFTVLESKETPGLGDRIGKDPGFLENVSTLDVSLDATASSLAHPVEFVKEGGKTSPWQVEGISGATISSRAVANMLDNSCRRMLPVIMKHLDELKEGA